jgi:hypothetical protein
MKCAYSGQMTTKPVCCEFVVYSSPPTESIRRATSVEHRVPKLGGKLNRHMGHLVVAYGIVCAGLNFI